MSLKALQDRLPEFWYPSSMPESFNKDALPHRHFNHALTHAMKALGALAAIADAMDHEGVVISGHSALGDDWIRADAGKYLADLIICATKMADELGHEFALDKVVEERIAALVERWGRP